VLALLSVIQSVITQPPYAAMLMAGCSTLIS
jgi:hypothetical protein